MTNEDLNRRIRAARNMPPEQDGWSEDYIVDSVDWPDAPLPYKRMNMRPWFGLLGIGSAILLALFARAVGWL